MQSESDAVAVLAIARRLRDIDVLLAQLRSEQTGLRSKMREHERRNPILRALLEQVLGGAGAATGCEQSGQTVPTPDVDDHGFFKDDDKPGNDGLGPDPEWLDRRSSRTAPRHRDVEGLDFS